MPVQPPQIRVDPREDFEEFYAAMAPICRRTLRRVFGTMRAMRVMTATDFNDTIESAVNDALAHAARRWDQYDPSRGDIVTWVTANARHRFQRLAQSCIGHTIRRAVSEEAEVPAPAALDAALFKHDMAQVLDRLKPEHARIIRLCCQDGWPVQEAAAAMDISGMAAQSLLKRARESVRRLLKAENGGTLS